MGRKQMGCVMVEEGGATQIVWLFVKKKIPPNSEVKSAPSFMMVLTGTPLAYRREDGIIVCPLGCLRP